MFKLLLALLLLAPPTSQPESASKLRDRAQGGPMPVTDKDLRPTKAPDCRNEAEVQKALQQLSEGGAGDCFIRTRAAYTTR